VPAVFVAMRGAGVALSARAKLRRLVWRPWTVEERLEFLERGRSHRASRSAQDNEPQGPIELGQLFGDQ
jgi:hypothetical protein